MANSEQEIIQFTTTVRMLLSKYKDMQKELSEIKQKLCEKEKNAKDMEVLAAASLKDYDMLKAAKMLEISDGDIEKARSRVNKLIRDVNRCITLLTEQQSNL